MVEMTTQVDKSQAEIEELKISTIWWSISGSITLYAVAAAFPDPLHGCVPGVILTAIVTCRLGSMIHFRSRRFCDI